MDPAYHIDLTSDQLALLGEIAAIIGLIDEEMTATVGTLLKVDRLAANVILGSSKMADNFAIWSAVIRNRVSDEDTLWLVKHVGNQMDTVSAGRNDFIHAVFGRPVVTYGGEVVTYRGQALTYGPPEARRVRKVKTRPLDDLPKVRDQAAYLSCLVAHVCHLALGKAADASPWLERLAPSLPPHPPKNEVRKTRGQRGQRSPS